MVQNSSKTYGDLVTEAMLKTDVQSVGETWEYGVKEHLAKLLVEAIEGNRLKKVKGKYFIWVLISNDPYANNALKLMPICRRTPPDPYFTEDHMCWSYVPEHNNLQFEWNIPKKSIAGYVLANPTLHDPEWVRMLRKYQKGELLPCKGYSPDMEKEINRKYNPSTPKLILDT